MERLDNIRVQDCWDELSLRRINYASRCSFFWQVLNGVDADKLSASAKSYGTCGEANAHRNSIKVKLDRSSRCWTWMGQKVFPNAASDEEAVDLLWDRVKTCRVYEEDQLRLGEHAPFLRVRQKCLIKSNFQPFTTQRQGQIWHLACLESRLGISWRYQCTGEGFLPNMPTESLYSSWLPSKYQMAS